MSDRNQKPHCLGVHRPAMWERYFRSQLSPCCVSFPPGVSTDLRAIDMLLRRNIASALSSALDGAEIAHLVLFGGTDLLLDGAEVSHFVAACAMGGAGIFEARHDLYMVMKICSRLFWGG